MHGSACGAMNAPLLVLLLAGGVAFSPLDALRPDDASFRTQGATVRLLAAPADDGGTVRGAILFDLEPGWKSYWRDPGAAGLAPELRFTADGRDLEAKVGFPAPVRFDENGLPVNGYDEPFALAFEIDEPAGGTLMLDLKAGLCLDLCIPVAARLETEPTALADPSDLTAIERAFLALPKQEGSRAEARLDRGDLLVERSTGDDLFVEGGEGWTFGVARNEGSTWRVPVRSRPSDPVARPYSFEAVIADGGRGERISIELP